MTSTITRATPLLAMLTVLLGGCGQKADPFQACVESKTAQLKQADDPSAQSDAQALLKKAKQACLAAMPTVKEPTITGY